MRKPDINFIPPRGKFSGRKFSLPSFFALRARPHILLGAFLVVVGVGVASFYLFKFSGGNLFEPQNEPEGQVAGATCEVTGQLPKDWLVKYFGTEDECDPKVSGAEGDGDQDFMPNLEEYHFGTNPTAPDTDHDGLYDGEEIAFNKNPLGEGYLQIEEAAAEEYVQSLGPEYEQYSQDNIRKEVEDTFQPQREIILELPADDELIIIGENNLAGYEKYFNETKSLAQAEGKDIDKVFNNLFELSAQELQTYIDTLNAKIQLLKTIPVPSEIVNIHKFKIAQYRAGIKLFELLQNSYDPESDNKQFWADYFYQTVVAQQAGTLELLAWGELFDRLKASGEMPESFAGNP